MKYLYKSATSIKVLFIGLIFLPTLTMAKDSIVSFGVSAASGADSSATMIFAEYERKLNDSIGLAFRVGSLDYEYDDGFYREQGDGPGVEAAVRIYTAGNGMKGFYYGGGAGIWLTSWDYSEDFDSGSGDSTSLEVHFALGTRLANDKIEFNPSFQVGQFISSSAELGFYVLAGVAIGFPL